MKYLKHLIEKKKKHDPIIALTAYDYFSARILEECGVDIILVGDSYGMVKLGYDTTLPVSMEEMLIISKAVSKAIKESILIIDMPFLSYQISIRDALFNTGRFFKETKAQAVKIESLESNVKLIEKMVKMDVPVMGHIGLTPQSVYKLGGYKIQGNDSISAEKLVRLALALEDAGICSLVVEGVSAQCAGKITRKLKIPVIGIGSGPFCDGQILVLDDILGLNPDFTPRHAKKYIDLFSIIKKAVREYSDNVRTGKFPQKKYFVSMDQKEQKRFDKRTERF
ncbi:MAG: 3-methyl-2-oxobutanoate hydroxymethyltransferase [Spirochaetes bacterium]|nr:3-methyl-2-oxobutanoate hydroxymethyltransferase [Spirochaetota bacterium]